MIIHLREIKNIISPASNMSMFILRLDGVDQILECYRREKLLLFLVQNAQKLNHFIKIDSKERISTHNRFNKLKSINTNLHFKPECQKLFNRCRKIGFINKISFNEILKTKSTSGILAVLTDLGIILMSVTKFEFRDFIPLTYCRLMTHKSIKDCFAIQYQNGIFGGVLQFKSAADKQEWVNIIQRVINSLKE